MIRQRRANATTGLGGAPYLERTALGKVINLSETLILYPEKWMWSGFTYEIVCVEVSRP